MLKFTVTVIICISDKNPAGLNSKQLIASFEIYIGVFWKVAWSTLGLFDLSWFIILSIPSIDYWVNGCFFIKSVHCVLHGIDGDARRETVWQRLRGQNSVEWISSFMRKIYGNIFVSWNFCDHFWIAIENRFLRMLLLNVHCSVSCVKSMNLKQYLTLTSSKSSFIFITSEVLRSVRDIFFLLCCIHFVSINKLLLDIFFIHHIQVWSSNKHSLHDLNSIILLRNSRVCKKRMLWWNTYWNNGVANGHMFNAYRILNTHECEIRHRSFFGIVCSEILSNPQSNRSEVFSWECIEISFDIIIIRLIRERQKLKHFSMRPLKKINCIKKILFSNYYLIFSEIIEIWRYLKNII